MRHVQVSHIPLYNRNWRCYGSSDSVIKLPRLHGVCRHDLGLIGQVPNLPHKILTIFPHSFFSFPGHSCLIWCYVIRHPVYCWSSIISVAHILQLQAVPKQLRWSESSIQNEENCLCTWYLQKCPPFSSQPRGTHAFLIQSIVVVWGIIWAFQRNHQIKGWRNMAIWPTCPIAHLVPGSPNRL